MTRPALYRPFSIFTKLVILFLLVIVPLYAAGLAVNELGAKNVRTEISESLSSQAIFYLRSLEVELDRIMKQQREYINDTDLSILSIAPDTLTPYEKTNAVQGLQRRLLMIQSASPYIEKVSIHIPSLQQTISTDVMYSDIPMAEYTALKTEAYSGNDISLTAWQGRLFLCLTYPNLYFSPQPTPLFMLSVELSRPKLQQMLSLLAGKWQGGAIWVGADADWYIDSGTRKELVQSIAADTSPTSPQFREGIQSIRADGENMLLVRQKSELLNSTLLVYLPEKVILGPLQTYRKWFWILSVVLVAIVALFSSWIYRAIHRPMVQLVRAFRRAERGDFGVSVQYQSNDEFFYLYSQFNEMVSRIGVLINEVLEQKNRAQRSELKQLQAQIHPHFLYNSFFILSGLAKLQEYDRLVFVSDKLGQYFHYLTRNGSDEVSLVQEIHHAKAYVDIQQVRFSNRITVRFDEVPERFRELQVPRLIIQPLIENAYNHGLEDKSSGGRLRIGMSAEKNRLTVTVEDNGKGVEPEELARMNRELAEADNASEYTGMINVHRRTRLRFGEGSGLSLAIGELGGLKATLTILP